ncbi:ABC transporter ATP-binding protein [Intrasporangium oryzae NRRL B-24470]|uniref:ABC transporter ATP-binding protein n=1 Tax=Intrasporangium oryzae NRRL B-24470 TaxID=1386089 RepID=W9GCU6_9MICO|nr:ABC transporter ATP-binding protein [Intrasporangium oryzae NRRL B-24470]
MTGLDARVRLRRGAIDIDVSLRAGAGEVVAVLGPNGSGKTTTVLALAGVLPLEGGHVRVGDELWEEVGRRRTPQERHVGLMLADSLLFPHLRAVDNVAYGPRSRGLPKGESRTRALDELDRVGLSALVHARPRELSSGQAARVALARALATRPSLLLLDEPLAALDPDTRARTRSDLAARLTAYDGVTVLVTHDPLDALTLADRLVFVEDGRVTQTGTPADVLREPRSAYAGTVVGLNLYAAHGDSHGHVAIEGGGVLVTTDPTEGRVWATVPPGAVSLHRHEPEGSARNAWPLRITDVTLQGQSARVGLAGELTLTAEVTLESVSALALHVGQAVWASVKATEVRTYPR